MNIRHWTERIRRIGARSPIEDDLSVFDDFVRSIRAAGSRLTSVSDDELVALGRSLRERALAGESLDSLLPLTFAAVREAASRAVGLRPFDVQLMAGIAIHQGKLAEMNTGEGKTLAAVAPAVLHALSGRGVHVLTFNDYLARRDARWMGPVYRYLGLSVGGIQEGMPPDERRAAYAADVTYATAKEAGFDFLRSNLARDTRAIVQRPFHFAIVDEADSILVDEARVPLVIAGERPSSSIDPRRIAEVVHGLTPEGDWVVSEFGRNVELTDSGLDRVEQNLGCGSLHAVENYLLLTEVNQSLHAHVLLHRDVDYIVTDGCIELVDEFTGRVVDDRRWPDGLQAALEAKEGLQIRPGGRVLGSITLQHFLALYPKLAGMTATARSAAEELFDFYGLTVVPIPPNRPSIREDLADVVFTSREARTKALVDVVRRLHLSGRPVLVGTKSVAESEEITARLHANDISCSVLNAKNDEEEAGIIAEAGRPHAVTISTNMAGRGTDIRLGGRSEDERDEVVGLGGLFVIGTARHESRRIDDQLRGRAGRQGDPGTTQFFVSLDDDLLVRYGIDDLIPRSLRPRSPREPMNHPILHRELDRLQRIAAGKCFEIRRMLWRYSVMVERQRSTLHAWRSGILADRAAPGIWSRKEPESYRWVLERLGAAGTADSERAALLHFIDECWAEHLDYVAHLREGIHLVGIGGLDPLHEFHRQIVEHFEGIRDRTADRVTEALVEIHSSGGTLTLDSLGVRAPSATWTYLVNDQVLSELQQMLFGRGNVAFTAGAVLMTWPLLAAWAVWRRLSRR
jgi:preprotein translocase subunit SecA